MTDLRHDAISEKRSSPAEDVAGFTLQVMFADASDKDVCSSAHPLEQRPGPVARNRQVIF
jgi:hypothetical protein